MRWSFDGPRTSKFGSSGHRYFLTNIFASPAFSPKAETHLGRAVDRGAPVVTDLMRRTMILSPAETLLPDHDALTRLSTVEDVGQVGEVYFMGERLAHHVIDALDY